jgi:hypothetical protein
MKEDAHARWRTHLAGTLLVAAASMSTVEFAEVQKLSPDDLRSRFGLPPSCDPTVTALSTDLAVNVISVAIDCRVRPGETPSPAGPSDRQRPGRPPAKGS